MKPLFVKAGEIIRERRLPWFISVRLEAFKNRWAFYRNRLAHLGNVKDLQNSPTICFVCGFHGSTGGAFAVAAIANLLSENFRVVFVSYPSSPYNRLLEKRVVLVDAPVFDAGLFICDVTLDLKVMQKILDLNRRLVVTCHGLLNSCHGLTPARVRQSLDMADMVHFVGQVQQADFSLPEGRYEVIPNTVRQVKKTTATGNVGVVGNLNDPRKNVDAAVDISLASGAAQIHIWSMEGNPWEDERIVVHAWEPDKEKIYASFDVLVFMSRSETFGLVVIEALSAGIPCLLSDLPAFTPFRSCPGVCIIDEGNRKEAPEILDRLIGDRERLRPAIIRWWQDRYAWETVRLQWADFATRELEKAAS